jgi:cell division protease FtsH
MTKKWPARIAIAVGVAVIFVVLFLVLESPPPFQSGPGRGQGQIVLSEFLSDLDRGMVKDVTIQGNLIRGHKSDDSAFSTYSVGNSDLISRLRDKNVVIRVVPSDDDVPSIFAVVLSWIPLAVLVGIFWYVIAGFRAVRAALERIEAKLGAQASGPGEGESH